jgi:hypothetical protein
MRFGNWLDKSSSLKLWCKSWYKWVKLNLPYWKVRLHGYRYYIELPIAITRTPNSVTTKRAEVDAREMGASVIIVRKATRISSRSFRITLYAIFSEKESALLFKLVEDVGSLQIFKNRFLFF